MCDSTQCIGYIIGLIIKYGVIRLVTLVFNIYINIMIPSQPFWVETVVLWSILDPKLFYPDPAPILRLILAPTPGYLVNMLFFYLKEESH